MKDVVWLHIGTHKTGSTALQRSLASYDDGTTRYARLGTPHHSAPMAILFRNRPEQNATLRQKGISGPKAEAMAKATRARLLAELQGPARNLIISGEGLSQFPQPAMQDLANFLKDHARQIRILAYVRDPVSYASSMFCQEVKYGRKDFKLPDLRFRRRLEPSLLVFGQDAMEVVAFDRSALQGGDLFADAARRMGTDARKMRRSVANESISAEALALLYFWNRCPDSAMGSRPRLRARHKLISVLGRAFPGRIGLAPALIAPLLDPADLGWLQQTFDIDFSAALSQACLSPQETDISDEADLAALRLRALPKLQALARRYGAPSAMDDPDRLVGQINATLIRRETWKAPLVSILRRFPPFAGL